MSETTTARGRTRRARCLTTEPNFAKLAVSSRTEMVAHLLTKSEFATTQINGTLQP